MKPFIPHQLPIADLDWERLAPLTSKASLAVARYDGMLKGIVNPAVLLSPLITKEAVLSSQIEGTQATLIEVLQGDAGQEYDDEKQNDIKEIRNYRTSLFLARDLLKERSISQHILRQLHKQLTEGVRGGDKTPGQYRTDQNWIGKKGDPIERARYIPPEPIIMTNAMDDLAQFIRGDYLDPLVQIAVIHAQFEIIHPFNDGNGRLGRMLVPLFLTEKQVLTHPVLYISEYLEECDQKYRDQLLDITKNDNWQDWIEFFLEVLSVQADRNSQKVVNILGLYNQLKDVFVDVTRSKFAISALDAFFARPIINGRDFIQNSNITNRATANTLLNKLEAAGYIVIVQEGSGQRSTLYALPQLINIAEEQDIFKKDPD